MLKAIASVLAYAGAVSFAAGILLLADGLIGGQAIPDDQLSLYIRFLGIGLGLASVFGLIAKQRLLGIVLIVLGVIYTALVVFNSIIQGYYVHFPIFYILIVVATMPGILSITFGYAIRDRTRAS